MPLASLAWPQGLTLVVFFSSTLSVGSTVWRQSVGHKLSQVELMCGRVLHSVVDKCYTRPKFQLNTSTCVGSAGWR